MPEYGCELPCAIVSVPYSFYNKPRYFEWDTGETITHWALIKYPARERLCSPNLEPRWLDIDARAAYADEYAAGVGVLAGPRTGIKEDSDHWHEIRMRTFEECRKLSQEYDRMFVLGGDHFLTYPLLVDSNIEQLVVVDETDDGIVSDYHMSEGLTCGTWASYLRCSRPDIRYISVVSGSGGQGASGAGSADGSCGTMYTRDGDYVESHLIDAVGKNTNARHSSNTNHIPCNEDRAYSVDYPSFERLLGSEIEDRKTALSICGDSSIAFCAPYFGGPSLFSVRQLERLISFLSDRTDLVYVDLMEANLFADRAVKACKNMLAYVNSSRFLNP